MGPPAVWLLRRLRVRAAPRTTRAHTHAHTHTHTTHTHTHTHTQTVETPQEWVPGGELFHHLDVEGSFGDDAACFYAANVIMALEFLHAHGIVYRCVCVWGPCARAVLGWSVAARPITRPYPPPPPHNTHTNHNPHTPHTKHTKHTHKHTHTRTITAAGTSSRRTCCWTPRATSRWRTLASPRRSAPTGPSPYVARQTTRCGPAAPRPAPSLRLVF